MKETLCLTMAGGPAALTAGQKPVGRSRGGSAQPLDEGLQSCSADAWAGPAPENPFTEHQAEA